MTWAPLLIAVTKVKGNVDIDIEYQKGLKSLAGLLPRLEEVGMHFNIMSNGNLESIDGAFPSLRKVGGSITIRSNTDLKSLAGGFPALTSVVGNGISIYQNNQLTSVGTGVNTRDNQVFASLAPNSIKTLTFHTNGASQYGHSLAFFGALNRSSLMRVSTGGSR